MTPKNYHQYSTLIIPRHFVAFVCCLLQLTLCSNYLSAQTCDTLQSLVAIDINTDEYGYETAWSLTDSDGTIYGNANFNELDNNEMYHYEFCVPTSACLTFGIFDSFGDGLFEPGGYRISLNGVEVGSGVEFAAEKYLEFNCLQGQTCSSATTVSEGDYIAPHPESWYTFTPDSNGIYKISTCGAPCDTRVYIYGECNQGAINDDHEGASFYDDNQGGCDSNAVVLGFFRAGFNYKIRIGQTESSCVNDSIPWQLNYEGKIIGCTDPTSCNYNPLATEDDGSCIAQGDPNCPAGPDLIIREDVLRTTIFLDYLDNTDECLIGEGCLTGYGERVVLRFDTQIENIGEMDYIIGPENENQGQFSYDNCHNHFHFEGYAEYILFDELGRQLPASFKNGFCVLDLQCNNGGTPTYSCEYMGISAGCEDIYGAELDCQWIDITDLSAGDYTFATRVNWTNRPDIAGRVEKDMSNNWAQVCFNLKWIGGTPIVEQLEDCKPYVDCAGEIYGSTAMDCTGECGGTALRGDVDANGVQEMTDAEGYLNMILEGEMAVPCNDLNNDEKLTIYDAALLADCLNYNAGHTHDDGSIHEHCDFPSGIYNGDERASLSIMNVDWEAGFVDVGIVNSQSDIIGYQFQLSGVQIASVTSLVDDELYDLVLRASVANGTILGLSFHDKTIAKSNELQPLLRVEVLNFESDTVCIKTINEIINQRYEQINKQILGSCAVNMTSNTNDWSLDVFVEAAPNPFTDAVELRFSDFASRHLSLKILDVNGKLVADYPSIPLSNMMLNTSTFAKGVYFYQLTDGEKVKFGKLGMKVD